jgi:CheY-like chemotaxis protein
MNGLKYRILWVDDNIETFIDLSIDAEFEEFLASLGFHPEIIKFETSDKVLEHLANDRKFDLILSDLNLANEERGDTLINKIREGEIFTEVLFYSGKPGFEETAKGLYQDRVSFFSLTDDEGYRKFREKVYWLIKLTISKLQELENMRGLVMAETSELDVLIEDILVAIMSHDNEMTQSLRKYMVGKVEKNNNERQELFKKIEELTHSQLIKHRTLFDASKKSRTLNEYLKKSGLAESDESFKGFHKNYEKDVLQTRNDMAHAKSDMIDGIEYLVLSRGDGDQPIKINQEKCTDIRTNLRKYSEILQKIRGQISDGLLIPDKKSE